MPQAEGGYVSLENGPKTVYNTTTQSTGPTSVFESIKRTIGQAIGSQPQDDSLLGPKEVQASIISSR